MPPEAVSRPSSSAELVASGVEVVACIEANVLVGDDREGDLGCDDGGLRRKRKWGWERARGRGDEWWTDHDDQSILETRWSDYGMLYE